MESPILTAPAAQRRLWPARTPRERLVYAVVVAAGSLCFVVLAWAHLGLGALVFPPSATARQQAVRAGDYTVSLQLTSGQLTADGPNTLTLTVRDASSQPLTGANLRVHLVMTTMAMGVPALTATPAGAGLYTLRPVFGMAGAWRLDLTLTPQGGVAQHASFTVGVRWR